MNLDENYSKNIRNNLKKYKESLDGEIMKNSVLNLRENYKNNKTNNNLNAICSKSKYKHETDSVMFFCREHVFAPEDSIALESNDIPKENELDI